MLRDMGIQDASDIRAAQRGMNADIAEEVREFTRNHPTECATQFIRLFFKARKSEVAATLSSAPTHALLQGLHWPDSGPYGKSELVALMSELLATATGRKAMGVVTLPLSVCTKEEFLASEIRSASEREQSDHKGPNLLSLEILVSIRDRIGRKNISAQSIKRAFSGGLLACKDAFAIRLFPRRYTGNLSICVFPPAADCLLWASMTDPEASTYLACVDFYFSRIYQRIRVVHVLSFAPVFSLSKITFVRIACRRTAV